PPADPPEPQAEHLRRLPALPRDRVREEQREHVDRGDADAPARRPPLLGGPVDRGDRPHRGGELPAQPEAAGDRRAGGAGEDGGANQRPARGVSGPVLGPVLRRERQRGPAAPAAPAPAALRRPRPSRRPRARTALPAAIGLKIADLRSKL